MPPAVTVVEGDVPADLPTLVAAPMVAFLPVAVDLPGTVAQGAPVVVISTLTDPPSTSGDEALSRPTLNQITDLSKTNECVNTVGLEMNDIVSVSVDLLVDDEEMSNEEVLKIAQKRKLIDSVPNRSKAKKTSKLLNTPPESESDFIMTQEDQLITHQTPYLPADIKKFLESTKGARLSQGALP